MAIGVRARVGPVWPIALLGLATAIGLAAKPAYQELSTDRFMQHVAFLASDTMNGCGNGTPELDRAAQYIAAELESYGLVPLGQDDSFLQELSITVDATFGRTPALWINGEEQQSGSDFVTLPLSTAGTYDGPVAFAGYGITAPQLRWDDYADIDVTGKAVVVLTHQPTTAKASTQPFGSMSSFEMKVRNANAHGARAILLVRDPDFQPDAPVGMDTSYIVPHDMGLIAMYVSPPSLEPLFKRMGASLVDVKPSIDTALRPASFVLTNHEIGLTLTFSEGDSADSDWAMFPAKGILALTFFTGMHKDSHQPSDTADKINAGGAIKVLSIVNRTARRIVGDELTMTRESFRQTRPAGDYREPYFGAEPIPPSRGSAREQD